MASLMDRLARFVAAGNAVVRAQLDEADAFSRLQAAAGKVGQIVACQRDQRCTSLFYELSVCEGIRPSTPSFVAKDCMVTGIESTNTARRSDR